jgi:hypothetical protein
MFHELIGNNVELSGIAITWSTILVFSWRD